jgi:hypothetical protein
LFAPKCLPYSEHVPEKQLWISNEDLINKLNALYDMTEDDYGSAINAQYKFLNTPMHTIGAPVLRNLWLDDNIDIWRQVLFMPKNGLKIPVKNILATAFTQNNQNSIPYQNDLDNLVDKND